jgi:steroid 5-alpha reductase family enzyme
MRPLPERDRIDAMSGGMLFEIALGVLGAMTGIMVAAWAFGLARRNGGWTDVFWTFGSGVVLIGAALGAGAWPPSPRQWLVAGFVLIWTLRLGLYLAPRVANHPEDRRYAAFREQWGAHYRLNMLWVTLPQAPATALLALSVILAAARPGPLEARDGAAAAIFLAAIAFEGMADAQMKRFRADPANRGGVIDTGLWAWSRHPNYFFQWVGWAAYPLMALDLDHPITWLSFAAPFVMYVLLRHVSGVPPLEAAMLKSRGEAFRDYQRRVSVFVPLPPKRAAA